MGDEETAEIQLIEWNVSAAIDNLKDVNAAYTASFFLTDALEDGFPGSILQNLTFSSLEGISISTSTARVAPEPVAVCVSEGAVQNVFPFADRNSDLIGNCGDLLVFEELPIKVFGRNALRAGRDFGGLLIPYNTLLITSILPTGFFYGAILFLAAMSFLWYALVTRLNGAQRFFLRAPFGITGFLIGVGVALFGL